MAAETRSYPQRLIGALHHPVPETRELAAEILGELQYRPAIAPLLARAKEELQQRRPDVQFLAALLCSARDLGAPQQEWQTLVAQANSRLLEELIKKDKSKYPRT
ncbi:hypothetical protein A2V82_07055 [candidate division KSB1 bacterium RBG_16_48_16]|nr:MAG: hypothetical protein A2V82_07055 [candidate division KSB1 bacterium RBG_16_48_16]